MLITSRWSAICRGAAMHGARLHGVTNEGVQIQSRVSRLSYGWKIARPFIPGQHHIEDKQWSREEGCYKAKDQMEWAIKRVSSFEYYYIARSNECARVKTSRRTTPSHFGITNPIQSMMWDTKHRPIKFIPAQVSILHRDFTQMRYFYRWQRLS